MVINSVLLLTLLLLMGEHLINQRKRKLYPKIYLPPKLLL